MYFCVEMSVQKFFSVAEYEGEVSFAKFNMTILMLQ